MEAGTNLTTLQSLNGLRLGILLREGNVEDSAVCLGLNGTLVQCKQSFALSVSSFDSFFVQ